MEKQVLSIEQMQHLQELGLDTSDASMHWQFLPTADSIINGTDEVEKEPSLFVSQPNMRHEYPAYTLQDIINLLPIYIKWNSLIIVFNAVMYSAGYGEGYDNPLVVFDEKSLLESAYNMLCWVIENGYLETNK